MTIPSTWDEYYEGITQATGQLKAMGASVKLLNRIRTFDDDCEGRTRKPIPSAVKRGNQYGLVYQHNANSLTVLFSEESLDWEWIARFTVGDDDFEPHSGTIGYKGKPTYFRLLDGGPNGVQITDLRHPHYFIPDTVIHHIAIPEKFDSKYGKIIPRTSMKMLWRTAYYDGPISGYCLFNETLCHYNQVDETEFEQRRLYGIYKLTPFEQIVARWNHYKWSVTISTKIGWWIYHKTWKWRHRNPSPQSIDIPYRQPNRIVGYFGDL